MAATSATDDELWEEEHDEPIAQLSEESQDFWPHTDLGNAERLVARHGERLRYVHAWKSWLVWDGKRWERDATAKAERYAKETVRHIYKVAGETGDEDLEGFARRSEGDNRLRAMLRQAQSEEGIPVEPDDLDVDPLLLNVDNGTLDLRDGKLRPHNPDDLITKLIPIPWDPKAKCPTWQQFLRDVMPDGADRRFLQKGVGYSLTGEIREHVLFLMQGGGDNGKTTFIKTVMSLLGEYAQQSPSSLLITQRSERIRADVGQLKGVRLAAVAETQDSGRLDEEQVKKITGGDRISAEQKYVNPFEFDPTHKLWLSTNHKPIIRETGEGTWRRIRLVPFTVSIPKEKQDDKLPKKLWLERAGILRWMVKGCLAWQREGLGETPNITNATREYRKEQDIFGRFLEDRCVVNAEDPNLRTSSERLYRTYKAWADHNNFSPMTSVAFGRKLGEDNRFSPCKVEGTRGWQGIAPQEQNKNSQWTVKQAK